MRMTVWQIIKYSLKRLRYGAHYVLVERGGNRAALLLYPPKVEDLHWLPLGEFSNWCKESDIPIYHTYKGVVSDGYEIVAEPKNTVALRLRWL